MSYWVPRTVQDEPIERSLEDGGVVRLDARCVLGKVKVISSFFYTFVCDT